jgi:ELWxxDGT repeat protein/predicted outer membrane repeat protein
MAEVTVMRGRWAVLGVALAVSMLGMPTPASAAEGIHLQLAPADEHGCSDLEVWNGDTLVKVLEAWEETRADGTGVCWLNHRAEPLANGILLFDWEEPEHLLVKPVGGTELWGSDGTADGTRRLTQVSDAGWYEGTWEIVGPMAVVARWGDSSRLVATRGTPATTAVLPGRSPGHVNLWAWDNFGPPLYVRLGSRIVYVARHPTRGRELWISDGTRRGSHLIADLRPGPLGSTPRDLAPVPGTGRLRFTADDGTGRARWTTDGTRAGTRRAGEPRCMVRNLTHGTHGHSFAAMVAAAADGDRLSARGICLAEAVAIATDITIAGPRDRPAVLDARGGSRVLSIRQGAVVRLSDVIVTAGRAKDGGGILNAGRLTLAGATSLQDDDAWNSGGGIFNRPGGTLLLVGTASVRGNTAEHAGGGIANEGTLLLAGSSSVQGNTASSGGGIANGSGGAYDGNHYILTLRDSSAVHDNSAGYGGGITNEEGGILTLAGGSSVQGNNASMGGGIANEGGTVTLQGSSSVQGNTATRYDGGGISNARSVAFEGSGTVTLKDTSSIHHNTATTYGGGISNEYGATLVLDDSSSVHQNSAVERGGGVYNDPGSTLGGPYCGTLIHDNDPDDCAP